ncbi:hypothetical protein ABZ619_09125 [Streptomyces sp. NPDC007851]|uniref:hypothetical protein n=1 Tax=Streptomyces sp. NPDC007851 TaxID=3155008 RepID=UPI0033EE0EAB
MTADDFATTQKAWDDPQAALAAARRSTTRRRDPGGRGWRLRRADVGCIGRTRRQNRPLSCGSVQSHQFAVGDHPGALITELRAEALDEPAQRLGAVRGEALCCV